MLQRRERVHHAGVERADVGIDEMGLRRCGTKTHTDAAEREVELAGTAHCAPPRRIATRCIVQHAPSDPTVYPGNAFTQRGQRISNWRNERSRSKINSTNDTWPISTPTLNITSAKGISPAGRPSALSPLAKPKPCNSPNAKATIHGCRVVTLVWPLRERTISIPRIRIENAMAALSGGAGRCA